MTNLYYHLPWSWCLPYQLFLTGEKQLFVPELCQNQATTEILK